MTVTTERAAGASGTILLTLASAQFLMTLDSSVMNVSIATVASDVGTTVAGIQTAITMYTLVMASLMITGGKIGQILGRKQAFAIGCVIYGCGSFVTAISQNLATLLPMIALMAHPRTAMAQAPVPVKVTWMTLSSLASPLLSILNW